MTLYTFSIRTLFLLLFSFALAFSGYSQTENSDTPIGVQPKKKAGYSKLRSPMLDLGVNTYFHQGSLSLPFELNSFEQQMGKSINVNLHLFRHRVGHMKSPVSFEYGLSVNWANYEFENDFRIDPNASVFTTFDDGIFYRKNKLKTTFIEMPLQLVFAKKPNSSKYISLGVYGGVLVGSKQKLKSEEFGKENIYSSFQLNKFRYGFTGQVNLGPVGFYAQYSLVPFFRQDAGPELFPFNVGISLLGF